MNLVGNDLLESGRYIHEHSGIDLEPAGIVEELLDRVSRPGLPRGAVASRRPRAAGTTCARTACAARW